MIHRKILTIALAVFVLAVAVSPALAAKAPHRYSPKHGAKCRRTYKRVKHGRKVYCVKQKAAAKGKASPLPTTATPTVAAPTEKTKLHAHLDPSFTRNPLNPFEVTYAYSASASQQSFSAQSFAADAEEPTPLPSGVLSLFSDGKLECAINVGSGVEGSECPVSYQALGAHSVTTIYTSGEESATETETEQIEPLPTSTTLSVSYSDVEGESVPLKEHAHCFSTGVEHRCEYEYEWLLGHLFVEGGSSLGATRLSCLEGLGCAAAFGGKAVEGTLSAPVTLTVHIVLNSNSGEHPSCEELRTFTGPTTLEYEWSYPTGIGLEAISGASGYATSSATASRQFEPTLPC